MANYRPIVLVSLASLLSIASSSIQAASTPNITGIYVDVAHISHFLDSAGDTWDLAWADDDNLYTFADDGRGFNRDQWRNFNFNVLMGPSVESLVGASVNTMDDYGHADQQFPNGATWKSTGCECIDGVLYAFAAPNWYGDHKAYGSDTVDPYLRQTVLDMSLIKSTDHGKTWTRSEAENYQHPMWTSYKFSTAYFFKYGKNGGNSTQDDQDKYVYAISNDGYWNDGDDFYLGRVPRAKIGGLNAADWQFYYNGAWTSNVNNATPIPGFPNGEVKCSSGSPIFLAPIHKYVTVTWYDPEPADTRLRWDYPADRIFDFYQADHPWGPWSIVGEEKATDFIADPSSPIHRWYGPSLCSKFMTVGADGSVTALLTFSGQTWEDQPGSLYKLNCCPVTFYTTPQPRLLHWFNDNDVSITYSDGWDYEANYGQGDYRGDEHRSTTQGSTASFSFIGSGLEIITAKSSDLGKIDVSIDDVSKGQFDELQSPFPRLYQIPIYRDMHLGYGKHSVVVTDQAPSGTPVTLDGYKTYGEHGDAIVPDIVAATTRYEAESGAYGSATVQQDSVASGGAEVVKLDGAAGSGVKFENVAAGSHLAISYCTDYAQGRLSLYLNGNKVQDVVLPGDGAWSGSYTSVTIPIQIPAGAEIKLQYDTGDSAANIDYIDVY